MKDVRPPRVVAGFARGFEALHNRNYRLYWFGQLISNCGTWMQSTAQAWLVLQLTHSPFAIGLVATFQFMPVMLLALIGGVIADRLPRYRVIISTQTAGMLLAAAFGVLVGTGAIQLWQIYVLALLGGVVNAIDSPVRQAFAVDLVGPRDRANAIALNSMLFNAARIVGPAVAGVLIGPLGIATIMYVNAASFFAVLAGLLMMDPSQFQTQHSRAGGSVLERLREGLRYIRVTPDIFQIMIVMAALGTFGYNLSVVLPLIGGFILHTDAVHYGALGAGLGVGSLAGSVFTAYGREVSFRRLVLSATAFSLLLGVVALTANFDISVALLLLLGLAGVIFTTTANTLLQLRVPNELRGRVMSVYLLLFLGSTPIGGLLVGTLARSLGVGEALVLCAVLCLAGVGAALLYGRTGPIPQPGAESATAQP